MLLRTRHEGRPVQHRAQLQSGKATPHEVLAEFRAVSGAGGLLFSGGPCQGPMAAALQDFSERHMTVRDDLAWRAARGLTLTEVERATLMALDSVLDQLEGPPAALPPEVQAIVRDTLRR